MTPQDLLAGPFGTSDLAEVAGVTKNVIADWIARDIITDTSAPGRGRDRSFTLWNVIEAIIAANLSQAGIKSGSYKRIIAVAKFEALTMNTYTMSQGGLEDFVVVVRVGADGQVTSTYREGPRHRNEKRFDSEAIREGSILSLRINATAAIIRARKILKISK